MNPDINFNNPQLIYQQNRQPDKKTTIQGQIPYTSPPNFQFK